MKRGTLAVAEADDAEDTSTKRCRMTTTASDDGGQPGRLRAVDRPYVVNDWESEEEKEEEKEEEEEEKEEEEEEKEEEEERRDFVPLLVDGFDASFQPARNESSHHVTHDTFAVAENTYQNNAVARGTYAKALLTDQRDLFINCLPTAMRKQCLRHNWASIVNDDILDSVYEIAYDGLARCDVARQWLCSHPKTLDFPNDFLNRCESFYNDLVLQNSKTRYARASGAVTLSRLELLCVCVLMCGPQLSRYGLGIYQDHHVSMREEAAMTNTVFAIATPLQMRHYCADKCHRYTLERHELRMEERYSESFAPAPRMIGHWRQEAIVEESPRRNAPFATTHIGKPSLPTTGLVLRKSPPVVQHTACSTTLPFSPCGSARLPCFTEPQAAMHRFVFWLRSWLRVGVTLHYRHLTPPFSWGTIKLLAINPPTLPKTGLMLHTTQYAWETVGQHTLDWDCVADDALHGLCFVERTSRSGRFVLTAGSFARAHLGWQVEQFLHSQVQAGTCPLVPDLITLIGMYFN